MPLSRRALCIAILLLPAACATAPERPGSAAQRPVPVAVRLTLKGATATVLGADGTGQLSLTRDGADKPLSLPFANGALAIHDLAPGHYQIAALGPLQCRGLAFEVSAAPRYLGAVNAELVKANYRVALMSRPRVPRADVAEIAAKAGVGSDGVDARPLEIPEDSPCFLGPNGPVTTWEDLTLGEKVILGAGVAGFCVLAVAAGGFCHF